MDNNPDGVTKEIRDIWQGLNNFRLDYEKRHADLAHVINMRVDALSERIARMEEMLKNVATKEDVVRMDGIVNRMEESLKQFNDKSEAMVTKTDVDWLKRSFWVATGAIVSIDIAIISAMVAHFMGN